MKKSLLSIKDLHVTFHTQGSELHAVRGIDYTVHEEEVIGIVGESGCGKSAAAKALVQLLPIHTTSLLGDVFYKGENLLCLSEHSMQRIRGKEIGMIFQDPMTSLNPTMKIGDQIKEGIRRHFPHLSSHAIHLKTLEMIEKVGIPSPLSRLHAYPHTLSGGLKQRAMIALALVCQPKLLIADEVTTALDVTIQAQILDLLQQMKQAMKMSVILITHDMSVVAHFCDRVLVMYAGKIVEDAPVDLLFSHPQHPYTRRLLQAIPRLDQPKGNTLFSIEGMPPNLSMPIRGCGFCKRCDAAMHICTTEPPCLFEVAADHYSACFLHDKKCPSSTKKNHLERQDKYMGSKIQITPRQAYLQPLAEVKQLSKHYSVKGQILTAVDNISFAIYPGETLGLVGESGCGKSTTGRCLLNLETPTAGQVFFENKDLSTLDAKELHLFRRQAQVIFQDPYASLNPRMTAEEIIAEPLKIHHLFSENSLSQTIPELLDLVGLSQSTKGRFPHEFSGGQRQRIGIARALAMKPRFIVCDEPISALDVSVQAQIINLLKKLQEQLNLSYLLIAHDLSMVKYISDRVAVMYLGHLVELAAAQELYQSPFHPYTKALLSAIPIPDPPIERSRHRTLLKGEIPSPFSTCKGCPFASRCPEAMEKCHRIRPSWKEISPGHFTACHLFA